MDKALKEILHNIFGHFVADLSQHTDRSDDDELEIEEYLVHRHALVSLCLVSKWIGAVATPLLYSHVVMFDGDIRYFTRTIVQDPSGSKSKLVKRMSYEFKLPDSEDPSVSHKRPPSIPQVDLDYPHCLGMALLALGADKLFAADTNALMLKNLNFDDALEEDLAAVLLFVLPNLRFLRICFARMTGADPIFGQAGYQVCYLLMQALKLPYYYKMKAGQDLEAAENFIPAGLRNLKQLILCNPFEEPCTVNATWPPIRWCDLEDLHPLWALPKLKSLSLERVSWNQEFSLGQLPEATSLEHLEFLDASITPFQLGSILPSFPRLRTFRYELADVDSLVHEGVLDTWMMDPQWISEYIKEANLNLEEVYVKEVNRDEVDEDELAALMMRPLDAHDFIDGDDEFYEQFFTDGDEDSDPPQFHLYMGLSSY
ncbi:unnamed protein product [Clonostachys rosea]|uniref:F-box domain-containing protein n=1 Tax=Bionectria ochroleuca TaxID=29856 RepID=A0ABY6V0U5_BIOOC|nr:unnamed protein product [Clonostachys rosea]